MSETIVKEQYSELEWLEDLFNSSESERTVVVAKAPLRSFDLFCQSQNVTREDMIKRYQKWFKPEKESEVEQDIAENKFLRANLVGKLANIFTDLEKKELRYLGKIKAIISSEGIEVEKKYQQGFRIKTFCKLMFSCNRFPKCHDQSQGFFRRWIIVKWDRNFENDPERIEYLKEKLIENKSEINLVFSNLVTIANRLNKVGRFTHTKDYKVIQKMWNENANPLEQFYTNCIIDSECNRTKRETYQFYKNYCYEI
ncbi:DUF5906 domain-containing protein [Nitrosopumilus ureiphilus]|uniref:NrS-1 polymerase-like helicase domain-containing protein n=1 Tax=Nitrosopumilus ureiphilus TaxID=1470067 RepID=A0A7D5REB8_9ARCH|nr:DUF5906 domain-containing protein [Nitrosopumilus ureiphilus]QLH06963.1 hypothetical protein C5F50_07665 [Nitrosopumilus ureiphilus]